MPGDNPTSIADASRPPAHRAVPWIVLFAAAVVAGVAAVHYAGLELTLSHYDARAHLVVSRRITDSLTPGWRQIGAVWLPLPHLLNMPVVMWDWAYQTGYPSVVLSIGAMAAGLAALSAFLLTRTGSVAAALTAPVLILLNPNVLYLQSTPMTEPLLLGLSFVSLWLVDRWIERGTPGAERAAGLSLLALALTRYEGWLVAGALVAAAAIGRVRHGMRTLALVPYLAAAIGGFLLLSWGATGVWFVASGFFEHDPSTYHDAWASIMQVYHSTQALAGWTLVVAAGLGIAACLIALVRRPHLALTLVLLAAAGLPFVAFFQGHPHRVRYMVPLVAAAAALASVAVAACPRRVRVIAAVALVTGAVLERPPFDAQAPMVTEAQWETPFRRGREDVTAYLTSTYDGTPILASMGSLGHYMQESSHAGFHIANFVHEGNGDLWMAALEAPERHVRWILIEERAEGGDVLASRARGNPRYLDAFDRVAHGGGVALFRLRTAPARPR